MLNDPRLRPACILALFGAVLVLLAGCSSSRPAQPTDETKAEQGPALSLLYTTSDAGLMLHDARRDSSYHLVADAHSNGTRALSPSGRYLAFSYATPDSSHLALLNLSSPTLHSVHAAEGRRTYSLAWHPEQDQLAFGFYRPTNDGTRGPGGIRVATPEGSTRNVGCRAAREVLHWLPDGSLATRDDDNLYVVAAEDCATLFSRDARRMYQVTYAPDGSQLAFIHRELNYDRSAGDYVPDSSLVLNEPRETSSEPLFGDERRVRHLRWGPDASELAFDVRMEDSNRRQVVVYDGSRTVYLTPPDQTTHDQMHPRWSPSGTHLAFTLRTEGGPTAAVRVKGQTRRLGPVAGAPWGWLDDRSVVMPGPDSLRVKTLTGQTRYSLPAPATLLHVWQTPVS